MLHFITFQYPQEIIASSILRTLFAVKLFKKQKNKFFLKIYSQIVYMGYEDILINLKWHRTSKILKKKKKKKKKPIHKE